MTDTGQTHGKNELSHLQNQIAQCRLCRDLFGFEPHPIVRGNHNAKIMQISQAPSKRVHETGLPFNDSSGKRLREEWYGISDQDFYNPDIFYIASMAHCYPGKSQGKGDRHPPKICSRQWLLKEMALVGNEIYLIIGGIAAKFFFPKENDVLGVRGQANKWETRLCFAPPLSFEYEMVQGLSRVPES